MGSVALSGSDALTINNRVFSDFADGDAGILEFPNDSANVKTGKNGNAIYGLNETGRQADFTLRLIRGSADDKFMNSLLAQQQVNFAAFALMQGSFVKKIGDGQGNIDNDNYILGGGIFSKKVGAKSNIEGDTEQSVSVYHIKWSSAERVIT